MFGAVNSRSGQTHFRLSAHKRSLDFQQFVDHEVVPAYPQADFIFLIVDGASIYESKSTLAWLKERPQIVLVPLPSYAPKLNLQEQIWRWLRADVTHDHFFGSLDAVVAAAKRFFCQSGRATGGHPQSHRPHGRSTVAKSCSHYMTGLSLRPADRPGYVGCAIQPASNRATDRP